MSLARFIDHTVLKNTISLTDVSVACRQALEHRFAAVCLPPFFLREAREMLPGGDVKLATVIGFPFGYHTYQTKQAEAGQALAEGADELDMVMNMAAFKSNDTAALEAEVDAVASLTDSQGKTLKVIIESGILTDEEIIRCCEFYRRYPVQFLKTSTGYAEKGASVDAVRLMRRHLPNSIQIKASGGIRTAAFAQQLIDAGASRLGCSAGIAIVQGGEPSGGY